MLQENKCSLGLTSPMNASMTEEKVRLRTFNNPKFCRKNNKCPTEQQLAQAGFYYMGESNKVKCWYCNCGCDTWEKDDDPWTAHAKLFPACPFLLKKKDLAWVKSVTEIFANLRQPEILPPIQVKDSYCYLSMLIVQYRDAKSEKCIVCREGECSLVLLPCGHFSFCSECIVTIQKNGNICPVCRHVIEDKLLLNDFEELMGAIVKNFRSLKVKNGFLQNPCLEKSDLQNITNFESLLGIEENNLNADFEETPGSNHGMPLPFYATIAGDIDPMKPSINKRHGLPSENEECNVSNEDGILIKRRKSEKKPLQEQRGGVTRSSTSTSQPMDICPNNHEPSQTHGASPDLEVISLMSTSLTNPALREEPIRHQAFRNRTLGVELNESERLNTLLEYPSPCNVNTIKLAKAGFFYPDPTSHLHVVKCICCKKEICEWEVGAEPCDAQFHEANCKFVKESTSQQSLCSTSHQSPFKNDARTVQQLKHVRSRLGNAVTVEGMHNQLNMREANNRLYTFQHYWAAENKFRNVRLLVMCGFYCIVQGDAVECFCCHIIIANWSRNDDPKRRHMEMSPRCRFIRGEECGDVPLQLEHKRRALHLPTRSPSTPGTPWHQMGFRSVTATPMQSSRSHRTERWRPTSSMHHAGAHFRDIERSNSMRAIPCVNPANSAMKEEPDRLQTFNNPRFRQNVPNLRATNQQLAEAGLYYLGDGDRTKWWFCDGGLKDFMDNDDTWVKHAKFFPD